AFALKAALAQKFAIAPDAIVLGNGSNDVLELVTHAFLRPGDHAVYAQHAFAVYPLATQARGATGIELPAKAFAHDLDAMLAAITPKTRVVFIANPNNPTGTWHPPDAIRSFIDKVPPDVLVVLDEAYNEYLDPADEAHATEWIERYRNLIVSRSFSKAYGLAALRVGYGVMDPSVADMLNRVRQPFNVNALAQAAAVATLSDVDYVSESRRLNREGIRQLDAGLRALGVTALPTHANFVLINVGDGARVYEALLRQGVIVRPVANYGLPQWRRGTAARHHRRCACARRRLAERASTRRYRAHRYTAIAVSGPLRRDRARDWPRHNRHRCGQHQAGCRPRGARRLSRRRFAFRPCASDRRQRPIRRSGR